MAALFLVVAIICFIFAAFQKQPIEEVSIEWVGMIFFAASFFAWADWINWPPRRNS